MTIPRIAVAGPVLALVGLVFLHAIGCTRGLVGEPEHPVVPQLLTGVWSGTWAQAATPTSSGIFPMQMTLVSDDRVLRAEVDLQLGWWFSDEPFSIAAWIEPYDEPAVGFAWYLFGQREQSGWLLVLECDCYYDVASDTITGCGGYRTEWIGPPRAVSGEDDTPSPSGCFALVRDDRD